MRAAAFALVFVAASVVLGVSLALAAGTLTAAISAMSLLGAGMAGLAAATKKSESPPLTQWSLFMLVVFALASLRSFLWLLYPAGDSWKIQSPNNLGDISLHLHIIRYLASGTEFWPSSPFLAGTPLNYYIGMDFFNSLLTLAGVPVVRGLIWVGLGGAVLSAWALWRWGGAFGLAAFLFNGGLAGFALFQTGQLADFQSGLAWKNFFLAMLVTQRGLLFALPASLFLWQDWRGRFFHGGAATPLWVTFLLYAAMPLFSAHAFLVCSLVLLGIFLFQKSSRRQLVLFVGCAFVPATIFSYLVTGGFSVNSDIRWLPGWMQAEEGWWFWALNFGVSLPLLILLAWRVVRHSNPELRSFAGSGLLLFLVCFFVAFAPWAWDNAKFLLWAWLLCVPGLWECIVRPLSEPLRSLLCVALFFSGAVSLLGGLRNPDGHTLIARSKLDSVQAELRNVPPQALIATEPEYNNPVILLGHPVVCGYEGHLWSHGLDYRPTWDALHQVLARNPGWEQTARSLGVDFLYLRGQGLVPVPPNPAPYSPQK